MKLAVKANINMQNARKKNLRFGKRALGNITSSQEVCELRVELAKLTTLVKQIFSSKA